MKHITLAVAFLKNCNWIDEIEAISRLFYILKNRETKVVLISRPIPVLIYYYNDEKVLTQTFSEDYHYVQIVKRIVETIRKLKKDDKFRERQILRQTNYIKGNRRNYEWGRFLERQRVKRERRFERIRRRKERWKSRKIRKWGQSSSALGQDDGTETPSI